MKMKFKVLIAVITLTLFAFTLKVSGATILLPFQGGTGIGAALVSDVGDCLALQDNAPFVYEFAPCGGGSGLDLEVEGTPNVDQTLLNLVGGTNMNITDNGDGSVTFDSTGGGIASINSDATSAQVLAVGTSGTDFAIADNGTGTHTFNLPTASASNRGALSSANWTTFNNKQNALSLTTTGSSGASTLVGATLNVPNYTLAGLGLDYGTTTQIPYMNAGGNDFIYSSGLTYDSSKFSVLGDAKVGGNTAFIDPYTAWPVQTPATFQISKGVSTSNSNSNFAGLILSHNLTASTNNIVGTITFQNEGTGVAEKRLGQMFVFTDGAINSGAYAFSTANAGVVAEKMRITKEGYVGIGISSSILTNLHIQESNTDTIPALYINQLSTGDSAQQFSIVGDAYAMGIDNSDNDAFKISYSSTAGAAVLGTNDRFIITDTGNVGIGTSSTVSAKLHVIATSNLFRIGANTTNYLNIDGSSAGVITFDAVGSAPSFIFADDVNVPDEAYGSGWNGSTEVPTKNALWDKIETLSGSSIVTTAVVLTPAQINGSNTTPVTLISAPGAGFYIEIIAISISVDYNTTPYTLATSMQILNPSGGTISNVATSFIDTYNSIRPYAITPEIDYIENEPVILYAPILDPTLGDSDITINLTYREVPL